MTGLTQKGRSPNPGVHSPRPKRSGGGSAACSVGRRPLLHELLYKPSTAIYMQNLTSNKAVGHQQHHRLRDFLSQAYSFHG